MSKKKIFVLGVCGKTASGKSAVLHVLSELGWRVLDADKIVHDLYAPGREGQRRIADFFGEEFIMKNGSVNRKKLARVVFGDSHKLKILNKLIHPLVLNEIRKFIDQCLDGDRVAVEAFYFDEKGLGKIVDKVLLVERPIGLIKAALVKREVAIDAVLSLEPVCSGASIILKNNSSLKALKKKVIIAVENL